MGMDIGDLVERHTRLRHQRDAHAHEGFVDDVEAAIGDQAVIVGHPAIGRVFDRQHGEVVFAALHRFDSLLERLAGDRPGLGVIVDAGLVAIGAGLSLKCDTSAHWRAFPWVCPSMGDWSRKLHLALSKGKRIDTRRQGIKLETSQWTQ